MGSSVAPNLAETGQGKRRDGREGRQGEERPRAKPSLCGDRQGSTPGLRQGARQRHYSLGRAWAPSGSGSVSDRQRPDTQASGTQAICRKACWQKPRCPQPWAGEGEAGWAGPSSGASNESRLVGLLRPRSQTVLVRASVFSPFPSSVCL